MICSASIDAPKLEAVYAIAMAYPSRCADAWPAMRPGADGFAYDGIANVCAGPNVRRAVGRILANCSLTSSIRGNLLLVENQYANPTAALRGYENSALPHPSAQSGLVVDFFDPIRPVV